MSRLTFGKVLAAWLLMLAVSVVNGALREFTYGRHMSELAAHQLSSLCSVFLLGLVVRAFVWRWPPASGRQALAIGLGWMTLTMAFEFLFFHFVGGHSWAVLLANFDVLAGRVWVFVLLWVALAPYLFFRWQRRG